MPPRVINFGQQTFQPITQQQTPKSVLAQLLLQSGFRRDNTAGSGIRSAGESILGALLQKQAFGENQQRLEDQSAKTSAFIKSAFPDEQGGVQLGQQFNSQSPDAPSNQGGQDVRFNQFFQPETSQRFDPANPDGAGITETLNRQGPRQQGVIPVGPGLPDTDEFQPQTKANELGRLLGDLNTTRSSTGGIDPNSVLNLIQQQQQFGREDAKATQLAQAKVAAQEQKQRDAVALKKTQSGDFKPPSGRVPKSDIIDGNVVVQDGQGGFIAKQVINLDPETQGKEVKRSDILEDGSAVLVFKDGSTAVRDRQGNLITGKDRLKVLQKSLRFSLDKARNKAGETEAGKSAIKLSTDMFTQASGIEQGIGLYDQAIAKVKGGAGTGPIISMYPSR